MSVTIEVYRIVIFIKTIIQINRNDVNLCTCEIGCTAATGKKKS